MRIVSWNEKDFPDLPAWQVTKDAQKGARMFRGASILGLQEIGEQADHEAFQLAFGKRFTYVFPNERTPILFNNIYFKKLDGYWRKTHDSVPGRTKYMGYGAVKLKFKLRPRLKPFWVFNTHMMPPPQDAVWRKYWNIHWLEMKADIANKHRAGLDVFLIGDLNIDELSSSQVHPKAVILAHHKKDYIILIPGNNGNKYARERTKVYMREFYTDHGVLELIESVWA